MSVWPLLRSGAKVQMPVRRRTGRKYSEVEFWGGGKQSYEKEREAPQEWILHYRGLREDELSALLAFCDEQARQESYFSFEDPVNGQVVSDCRVIPGSVEVSLTDRTGGEAIVGIRSVKV